MYIISIFHYGQVGRFRRQRQPHFGQGGAGVGQQARLETGVRPGAGHHAGAGGGGAGVHQRHLLGNGGSGEQTLFRQQGLDGDGTEGDIAQRLVVNVVVDMGCGGHRDAPNQAGSSQRWYTSTSRVSAGLPA